MSDYKFTLNMIPNTGTPVVVNLSQGDIGRELTFKLVEGSDPNVTIATDATAITIEGLKPSGLGFTETCTATSGNIITVSTTEAMTQESGMIPAEVRFVAGTKDLGTANIIFAIEESPHPDGTIDGTQETMQNLEARLQVQINDLDTRVDALEEESGGQSGTGITEEVKQALLQIARKVAYIDEHGQTYYNALEDALYPPAELSSITAVYTPSGTVYDTASLDDLKSDLVVTANYSDGTSETVTDYTLSGTLEVGTSTITVNYSGKTATFNVTVTQDMSNVETVTTLVNGTDWSYESGKKLSLTTGETSENSDWNTSEFIAVPEGSTSFSRVTSRTSDWYLCWYDSEQTYIGNGLNGTYSGNAQYGGGYTDSDSVLWNAVPSTAKYCKVSWRTSDTYTSLSFKHNVKLDATKTPIVEKVYYYTYNATSTGNVLCDDYLKCEGMAYAQIRPIYRRYINFYDSEFIKVGEIATANNIGNNVSIPSDAVYLKCSNTNSAMMQANNITRIGQGLIEFTDESLSTW